MYELPVEVNVEGNLYHIRNDGDYRVVLDCFSILDDVDLENEERMLTALFVFYDVDSLEELLACPDIAKLTSEMYNFFSGGREESDKSNNHKLIDWDKDSAMIFSAINNVAGNEVREKEYLHWWTFMGYYNAIGESTLSTVVSIREKIVKGKSLEKWERQYRSENPHLFRWNSKTMSEMEAEKLVLEMWNSKE